MRQNFVSKYRKKPENLQKGIALFKALGYHNINRAERRCPMLGYIRPYTPELRLCEYQYYRGVYCGLCRAMGRCTGQCSRLALSYDLVFLALTRLALANGNPSKDNSDRAVHFEKRRCLPHPLRRRLSLERGEITDYVACVAAVLNYYKSSDDRIDEKGIKKWRATLCFPAFRTFFRRADRHNPGLAQSILPHMEQLARMEAEAIPSADEPADAFGKVLATLFSNGLPTEQAHVAHHIGYHIGRWLYLIDAIDDYEQDVKQNRPNPLHRIYGEMQLTDLHRQDLNCALATELQKAADALDLVTVDSKTCGKELMPLLYHMLQVALPNAAQRVLFPVENKKQPKKASRIS